MKKEETILKIRNLIETYNRFLVCAHVNPDGDAIGASLGFGLALSALGKEAVVYNRDKAPAHLLFLPQIDSIVHEIGSPSDFDVIFICDCGELDRIGALSERLGDHQRVVNIDHHQTNDAFGSLNLVETCVSSTGELIYSILESMDHPIGREVAECLFTAIYTDTLQLSTASAEKEAFDICGKLADFGIDKRKIAVEYYSRQSEARIRLLARALNSLCVESGGKIAGICLTAKDLEETGTTPDDTEGFVDYPRNIAGVEVAYFLREEPDRIKGSFRSSNQVDVAAVAETMGGGGHARAAGFKLSGSLQQGRAIIVEKLTRALKES